MFLDHHRHCGYLPAQGAHVAVRLCGACGGWHVLAYLWSDATGEPRTISEVEIPMGPFDAVPDVLVAVEEALERLELSTLRPLGGWAPTDAAGDAG